MTELSVLIPARNERYLARTVADVCQNKSGNTNVIVVLDGAWPEKGYELAQRPDVHVIYLPTSIGQRAATNLAARASTARYIMKLDGHCSLAEGFDVALLKAADELGPNVTQIPAQRNLHVYNQVCEACGASFDQAPVRKECPTCKGKTFRQDLVWQPRARAMTTNWVFDSELHFQYASNKKQSGDICEVMSSLGACFFMERGRFWDLGGLDEDHGSWGQFGVEVALKSWLSGGRHVVNRRTWFAHFFRVGGINFPYPIKGSDQEYARTYSRNLWRGNHWPLQVHPLRWLVDKFWPVKGWTEEQRDGLPEKLQLVAPVHHGDLPLSHLSNSPRSLSSSAGIVFYTDGRLRPEIYSAVRRQLRRAAVYASGPLVSVSLSPIERDFGKFIELPLERGILSMFKQILAGLESLDTRYAFLAEHDVLYSDQGYFGFRPPRDDVYYYQTNVWHVEAKTGRAVTYTAKRTSQLCANRELLIDHYRKRIARVEANGFSMRMGFEPGSHSRAERVDDFKSDVWRCEIPSIDIKHRENLTPARWEQSQFRDQRNCQDWQESGEIPGWGRTLGRFDDFLREVRDVQQAVA